MLWNVAQIALVGAASGSCGEINGGAPRDRALVVALATPPLVSVIVPACNEALTIVESIRALLELDYESREIVVVNDGSSDDTLALLQQTFQLVPRRWPSYSRCETAPVRGVYRSILDPSSWSSTRTTAVARQTRQRRHQRRVRLRWC